MLGIIVRREYVERIKSKGFIIGTSLIVLAILAMSFIPLAGRGLGAVFTSKLVVVAPNPQLGDRIKVAVGDAYEVTVSKVPATGAELPANIADAVKAKKFDAALLAYQGNGGLSFIFYPRQANLLEKAGGLKNRLTPVVVNADLSGAAAAATTHVLDFPFKTVALNERYKSEGEEILATGLVYFLLIILYISTIMYGVLVAQGVIEEKSNRVMEVMIGALRPTQLLAGKILGIGALALTQMLIFALAMIAAAVLLGVVMSTMLSPADMASLQHAGSSQHLTIGAVPASTIAYLLVFFVLGFFSYAAMFAGMGALCSKAEDVQQLNGFLMIPVIAAYFLSILAFSGDPDKPFLVVASMIPLISPMLMFTRVAISSVPAWQIALSIAFSVAAIWGLTLLAGKLYRVGVLMYGKPPRPADILRALRAPS